MTEQFNRRAMLARTAAVSIAGLAFPDGRAVASASAKPKFTADLVGGAIGVAAGPDELLALAAQHGFDSLAPDPGHLAGLSQAQLDDYLGRMKTAGLVWGSAGLPVDFRKSQDKFDADMKALPRLAAGLQRAGATRISTWLSPYHESLTWLANFRQHVERLRRICRVVGDHGLRFGVEYVGTKTLWTRTRHSFIHSMAETKELIAEVNADNLGFVLDSWHWYTAGETRDDLLTLTNQDVVACDLNDAPRGIAVDQQIDNQRELPAATGVIDIKSFLNALVQIGYDGPIRAEPFNRTLSAMNNNDACAATIQSIRKAIAMATA